MFIYLKLFQKSNPGLSPTISERKFLKEDKLRN